MKLRFSLRFQQLLSAFAGALLLGSAAIAQDIVITNDGQQRQVKVIGVSPSGATLEFLIGAGKLGLPLNTIREVRMATPAEYTQAIAAYQAKDFPKALTLIKGLVDKYKGMPALFAQQAVAMLGELYIQTNDIARAEAAYNDFKRLYPAGGSLQADVGQARVAVAKKDYETAKTKLAPITEKALQEKIIEPASALAYSQAFLVSGQVKEAQGNFPEALEDYLRTVTLFYHDRTAVAAAQDLADALRKSHPDITAP